MALVQVQCPNCNSIDVVKYGTLPTIDFDRHIIGKGNTWKIERKHLTLRTRIKRLARRTICFSKSSIMHDIVIGLFVRRFEFGMAI